MLSPHTAGEMMNDTVKHIISLLHHHCNMTAKFHSSYPISSLFKGRKLLVPVIRYVALCVWELSPLPLSFVPQSNTQENSYTCFSRVWPSSRLTASFQGLFPSLGIVSTPHHPPLMPAWNTASLKVALRAAHRPQKNPSRVHIPSARPHLNTFQALLRSILKLSSCGVHTYILYIHIQKQTLGFTQGSFVSKLWYLMDLIMYINNILQT